MATKPVIIDATCPGCKKDHAVAVPMEDLNLAIGHVHAEKEAPSLDEIAEKVAAKLKPAKEEKPAEEKPKIVEKVKREKWMPRRLCGNGGCMNDHANEDYEEKVQKRCANGDCVSKGQLLPAKAAFCPWCESKGEDGKMLAIEDRFEDLDEDEMAKIPEPRHAHQHHEDE